MGKQRSKKSPLVTDLIEPIYEALIEMGNSASTEDLKNELIKRLGLTDEAVLERHGKSAQSEFEYQLAWAKTYLKKYGVLDASTNKSVWIINPDFDKKKPVTAKEVIGFCRKQYPSPKKRLANAKADEINEEEASAEDILDNDEPWKNEIYQALHEISPEAFEILAKQLLIECGFVNAITTRFSGDGGIDGYGLFKLNGLISFNVAIQCKRYAIGNNVGAEAIRDFRGSLSSDIERGLFITTSDFTKNAKEEAYAAGKKRIDLINGDQLIDMLIAHRIGVREKTIYIVDDDYFKKLKA